ncbi:MAG: NADH-quinone oxidoreductase subunit N [Candidatus Binatia bacterium]|jgi:NADH-quinone oxidoreductase subunit N|nr:NADH-quinone oxidoreductase subunit N [Candidatus Binatia bacterium]
MGINLTPLLPAAEVTLTGLTVLVLDLFLKERKKGLLVWISVLGLVIAGGLTFLLWGSQEGAFQNSLRLDDFGLFFTALFLGAAIITVLSSVHYLEETKIRKGEYHALILFATLGMILMATANDLILFFLGLETMSVAVYVLTGMWHERNQSGEAAMKYFINGAFASGFLLYGIALIYGATGSTNLTRISQTLPQAAEPGHPLLAAGILLLLIGLAFKVAAVPFHFWAPDVYEGAPTPVTGFMAVAVKAAAFAGWSRILMHQLGALSGELTFVLWAMAVLTMTVGNVVALAQESVKRMLAYSSIAHAGYLIIAVIAGGEVGGPALLFYLLAYTLMSLGAFAVVMALKEGNQDNERYGHFAGIGFSRPFLGMAMSIFMLSLAGFPPLGGFTGKFYLFRSAVASGHTELAIIGVLNSLLSVVYYLRVVMMMYMEEGGMQGKSFSSSPYLYVAIALAALGVLYLGIAPGLLLEISRESFLSLK